MVSDKIIKLANTLIIFIIHSKYFPDSDWLKVHVSL